MISSKPRGEPIILTSGVEGMSPRCDRVVSRVRLVEGPVLQEDRSLNVNVNLNLVRSRCAPKSPCEGFPKVPTLPPPGAGATSRLSSSACSASWKPLAASVGVHRPHAVAKQPLPALCHLWHLHTDDDPSANNSSSATKSATLSDALTQPGDGQPPCTCVQLQQVCRLTAAAATPTCTFTACMQAACKRDPKSKIISFLWILQRRQNR